MTVLIGLLCQDGIVIGADSSATFGNGQISTIEQPCKKVHIVKDSVILAGTGQVGLGQRYQALVERYWQESRYLKKTHIEIGKDIAASCVQDFISTSAPRGEFGALLAFSIGKNFHVCEFAAKDLQPEFKNNQMWYVSMGSGQVIADPFLGLLRTVFWGDHLPLLNEGVFYVTWALQHTIDLNTGGINGPMQIATLSYDETLKCNKARILQDDEILEHKNNVSGIHEHLRKYKETLQGKDAKKVPELESM